MQRRERGTATFETRQQPSHRPREYFPPAAVRVGGFGSVADAEAIFAAHWSPVGVLAPVLQVIEREMGEFGRVDGMQDGDGELVRHPT